MKIRLAGADDYQPICELISELVISMQASGLDQWNSNYPSRSIFLDDIQQRALSVLEFEGAIVGVITVDWNQAEEYRQVAWSKNVPAMVIHRLAVHPKFQGQGFAGKLVEHAEKLAKEAGAECLRFDAYTKNERACQFYSNRGFQVVGKVNLGGGEKEYHCFEKFLLS